MYVIVQNLDDASPEWIIPARSATCILESFYNLFDFLPYCSAADSGNSPVANEDGRHVQHSARSQSRGHRSGSQSQSQSHRSRSRQSSQRRQPSEIHGGGRGADFGAQDWSVVKLLEEYDPLNLEEVSRPYAYVADYVVPIDLSVSIADEIQKYEACVKADHDPPIMGPESDERGRKKSNKQQRTGWFEKLRDQLQRGEDIRWYVVVNGDEVRDWPEYPQERPTPVQQQQSYHTQYTLQQHIFEKDRGRRRDPKTTPQPPQAAERKPAVPEKDLPPIQRNSPRTQSKMPVDSHNVRPKTPKKGGLRRLFSRGKGDDPATP